MSDSQQESLFENTPQPTTYNNRPIRWVDRPRSHYTLFGPTPRAEYFDRVIGYMVAMTEKGALRSHKGSLLDYGYAIKFFREQDFRAENGAQVTQQSIKSRFTNFRSRIMSFKAQYRVGTELPLWDGELIQILPGRGKNTRTALPDKRNTRTRRTSTKTTRQPVMNGFGQGKTTTVQYNKKTQSGGLTREQIIELMKNPTVSEATRHALIDLL